MHGYKTTFKWRFIKHSLANILKIFFWKSYVDILGLGISLSLGLRSRGGQGDGEEGGDDGNEELHPDLGCWLKTWKTCAPPPSSRQIYTRSFSEFPGSQSSKVWGNGLGPGSLLAWEPAGFLSDVELWSVKRCHIKIYHIYRNLFLLSIQRRKNLIFGRDKICVVAKWQ